MPTKRIISNDSILSVASGKVEKKPKKAAKNPPAHVYDENDVSPPSQKPRAQTKITFLTSSTRNTAINPSNRAPSSLSSQSDYSSTAESSQEDEVLPEDVAPKWNVPTIPVTVMTSTFEGFGQPPYSDAKFVETEKPAATDSVGSEERSRYPFYGRYTPADHPTNSPAAQSASAMDFTLDEDLTLPTPSNPLTRKPVIPKVTVVIRGKKGTTIARESLGR